MGMLSKLLSGKSGSATIIACAKHTRILKAGVGPGQFERGVVALFDQFLAQHPGKKEKKLLERIAAHKPPCVVCFEGSDVILNRAIKQVKLAKLTRKAAVGG